MIRASTVQGIAAMLSVFCLPGFAAAASSSGTIEFSSPTYTVSQSGGSVTLTVSRSGGSTGMVHAAYRSHAGTALDGVQYINSNGHVNWNDGDASAKQFVVPIMNSSAFSGTKELTVDIVEPSGASVGSPSVATVLITGDQNAGASPPRAAGAPSAPAGLKMTGQTASGISLAWGTATPGSSAISHYKIYRNGSSYATSAATSYTDYGAIDATNASFNSAATIYVYAISAVDSQGNEGPKTTQTIFNVYYNGTFSWAGDYSYSASVNYKDNSGGPESGAYDIAVNVTGAYGGFQPYSGNVVPQWDLEAGSFRYMNLDLKPTVSGQTWGLSMISRLPPGDVYPWASVNVTDYGPAPVVGKWATYKIPLSALTIGKTSFQGSISGTTLTVTNVNSGVGVDAGGFVTGNGVKPGTYITGHYANGGAGSYTVYPGQNVSSTAMTEQRTGIFKFDLADQSGAWNNRYYIDNVKFTAQ